MDGLKRYCKGCQFEVTDRMFCVCGEIGLTESMTYTESDLMEIETTPYNEDTNMKELAKAKIKAESEMSALVADAEANTGRFKYSYPTLDNVFHVIRGPLANNDLALFQATVSMDGMIGIQSTLIHAKSGEVWEPFPLLMPASTNPQDNGKVLTYCRRYAIVAMFNLAVVDEDANTDARITYRQPPQSMNGVPEIAGGEPTEFSDPFMNHDIEFSREATALITKLRDLDKQSNKPMTAKQYQFMTGLVNGVVGEDKHSQVFATIFGNPVSSDAIPGWKAKELIDWLNGSAEDKPAEKQAMAKKAIGEIAAKTSSTETARVNREEASIEDTY